MIERESRGQSKKRGGPAGDDGGGGTPWQTT